MDATLAEKACLISSLILRIGGYIFLRWIPGHVFPHIIFSAFAVFVPAFYYLFRNQRPFEQIYKNDVAVVEKPSLDADSAAINTLNMGEKLQILRELKAEDPGSIPDEPHVELRAIETVVSRRKDPKLLRTVLGGVPSPSLRGASIAGALLNAVIVLFVADLTYRSTIFHSSSELSFARPGYVSGNSARLLIREPDPKSLPISIYVQEENGSEDSWTKAVVVNELSKETDFVATVTISGLQPEKSFRYRTSTGHVGRFRTAPSNGSLLKQDGPHGKFTFLTSSCIKARVPYNPLDHPLAVRGLHILGRLLERGKLVADFMLFLGDFIYIDVPRRPSGDVREGYRMHYRQIYNSPDWPGVGKNLPWLHVIDDHEIANDWDKNVTGIYPTAMDPFHIYQHSANPPPHRVGETYYSFVHGAAAFFLLDSRRYRSPSSMDDGPAKTFLGRTQLEDLLAWIRKEDGEMHGVQWKFVVSSSPFTKNWRFDATDTWGVYLHERQKLLEAMWEMGGKFGYIVLSGDRHEFGATAFPPPNNSVSDLRTVMEFSCSPLSQFYLPARTYSQKDDEDVMIKYIPDGNSKFGAVEVDATNKGSGQAVMRYRLFVDGEETWDYTVTKDLQRPSSRELWY